MDETVKRAMLKWPNVPYVFGWLRLDRRGNWLLRSQPQRFERIGNAALLEFIGRNYGRDGEGRWFFQNGPQRVFVGLDYMPFVYRLGDSRRDWLTQCGQSAGEPRELLFDEDANILLVTDSGAGLVADRDLPALLEGLTGERGEDIDAEVLIASLRAGQGARLKLFGVPVAASAARRADLPARFGFIVEPESAHGQDGQD